MEEEKIKEIVKKIDCDGCFGAADLQCPKIDTFKSFERAFEIDIGEIEIPKPQWPKTNPYLKTKEQRE